MNVDERNRFVQATITSLESGHITEERWINVATSLARMIGLADWELNPPGD